MTDTILSVRNLHVRFRTGDGILHAVKGIDLDIGQGETVAIVGESGSGKSQTMMSVMGLLASNGWVEGSVSYRNQELIGLPPAQLNKYRGSKLTMIFQEPMTSLDPLYKIGDQLILPLITHGNLTKKQARDRALELLGLVGIPDPQTRIASYPHELSGGQRQRVMIAMALGNNPDILIADEPTTALDVTVQARILDLLANLQKRIGMSIVFITHDLGVVKRFADRTYVMKKGEIVESGKTTEIFSNPAHSYTKMLLDSEPKGSKTPVPEDAPVVLDAKNIKVSFPVRKSGFIFRKSSTFQAVNDISFSLRSGETLGVVGESGSGKSTLGRAVLNLLPASGIVSYEQRNLMTLERAQMRPLRRDLQMVFQDPFGSLSPRMTVGEIVTEGLLVHEPAITRKERDQRAIKAFEEVQLDPNWRNRYPHEFSGGQRQRIAIARAMILHPKLVVLDEPTSALDRSVQKEIIDLLKNLQNTHGLAYVFISHDLAVVRALSDKIIVMQNGVVVERGTVKEIFDHPTENYTKELIAAAFLNKEN